MSEVVPYLNIRKEYLQSFLVYIILFKTYKGREGPVLVCFIPHAIITFNISLQDHFIGRIVKPE